MQRDFNGLGQVITEYQAHSGSVNTSTTPKVQYAYSEMSGGANHSRLTSLTYPNGKVLTSNYSSGLDSTISRLSSLSDTSGTLESYSYLGLGTVVVRSHPQPGIDLTYVKQSGESNGDAGDPYTGLDRFGRIVDQRWRKSSDGSHTDRFLYGYDRDSNRLYRTNELNHNFDELYHANGASNGYDALNQLSEFRRGTLTDTNSDGIPDTVSTASRSQVWSFDPLGNWSSLTTDGTSVNRTHNKQNQVTAVGSASLTFDSNGNTTTDETGKQFVYDAWNRLIRVKDSGGTTLTSYQVDALTRRVVENPGTARDLYYSVQWQVLEERVAGAAQIQYIWSPVYVDALILRDRDADASSGNGLEERLWVQQDGNWNVTGLINASGVCVERVTYTPYGISTVYSSTWTQLGGSAYDWIILHQGGRYDEIALRYHFRRRDYTATLGRWEAWDPLSYHGGDTNLYRYQENMPTQRTDCFGLSPYIPRIKEVVNCIYNLGWDICMKGWEHAVSAQQAAEDNYSKAELEDGRGNAFQHCYWACLMRQDPLFRRTRETREDADLSGSGKTRVGIIDPPALILRWHEYYGNLADQRKVEDEMDSHNNLVGLTIGDKSDVDCAKSCHAAVKDGSLREIRNGKLEKTE